MYTGFNNGQLTLFGIQFNGFWTMVIAVVIAICFIYLIVAVDLDGVYYDFDNNTSYKSLEIVNKIATVLASGFSIDLKLMPEVGRRIIKEAITNRKKAQK